MDVEIRHFHLFCGLGGGARGFNRGEARLGGIRARFRCLGGVDSDPAALADFARLAGVPGACLDLFDRAQYCDFHGREPPAGWREATPDDIRRAAQGERPHIVFTSAPCKGFSGLLSETASRGARYQALNRLTLRGVWLALEAWPDDPPELILFENVPRIASRGRALLDRIVALLRHHGYAVAETTHDCGELGNLGQSRKRFLLVARHAAKVPGFLYEPPRRPLRGVGEVLERLPLPLSGAGGPMHRMPALQWQTWVRLAFVEAGSDWRSLNRLAVAVGPDGGGWLRDFAIAADAGWNNGVLGVRGWDQPAATVTSNGRPGAGTYAVADPRPPIADDRGGYGVGAWEAPAATLTSQRSPGQGRFAVADPRVDGHERSVQLGVRPWDAPAGVVTGKMFVGGGPNAVADPRTGFGAGAHSNKLAVMSWDRSAGTITGSDRVGSGALSVADPRLDRVPYNHVYRIVGWGDASPSVTGANGGTAAAVADPRPAQSDGLHQSKYRVTRPGEPAGAVIAASTTGNGAFAVADPRPGCLQPGRDYLTAGHYGVTPWQDPAGAVTGSGQHDNGRWSVADPRAPDPPDPSPDPPALPPLRQQLVCVIRALDGTWHRPFTTLELAALQGLVDPEEQLALDGLSDSAWRERIGNAVPPPAAAAIAGVMGRVLLGARAGETFRLSAEPIWVRDVAVAIAVATSIGGSR